MNKETFLKILQLDSIVEKLTWRDRMVVHFFIQEKIQANSDTLTHDIFLLYDWIRIMEWQPPEMKYGQDRLKYCFDDATESLISVEEYREKNEELLNTI